MRCLLIPVVLLSASMAPGQSSAGTPVTAGAVAIPAELKTSIRADKVHRGDSVELRSVEPVLLGNGVVMPANAKISGRIVGAAPIQKGKPSWLVLLIEQAEWKQGSARLHAFISRQIKIDTVAQGGAQGADGSASPTSARRAGRISARVAVENGVDNTAIPLPHDSGATAQPTGFGRPVLPKEIRLVTDSDGIVYLFSEASNVHLPSGVLLVLQNQAAQPPASSAGSPQQFLALER
jgi:hypothetical protein